MLETLNFVFPQLFSQMPYVTSEVDIWEENKLDSKIMITEESGVYYDLFWEDIWKIMKNVQNKFTQDLSLIK